MIEVIVLPEFARNLKRLNKKYGSLKLEFKEFVELNELNGIQGTQLGNGLFKARIAVKSKGKGKSGGLRIISYQNIIISQHDNTVYMVAVYDKSELSTMEVQQMNRILRDNGL